MRSRAGFANGQRAAGRTNDIIVAIVRALPLLLLIAGCAAYHPAPLAPVAIAQREAEARLDAARVAPLVAAIAPDAAWNGNDWDRLSLFAAMLQGNADIAAARTGIATARAARRAAGVRPGPTLTLTAEYAGKAPEASPWLFGGSIDVPIDGGGRRASRLAIADLGITAARYDFAETVWMTRMALRRALTDRLVAARRQDEAAAIVAVRQRQFDIVARRVAAGAASRAELERVRADAADGVRKGAEAAAQIVTADAGLAAALGVPATSLAGLVLVWPDFETPPPAVAMPDAAQRQAALAARADVLKAMIAYDQAEADLRGEIARQYPAINIGPGYTWERGLVKLPINFGFALPPLDGNRGAIAAATARRAEAGGRLEAVIAGAQATIDGALAGAVQARRTLAAVRSGELPAAQRLARQADSEVAAGAIDRGEWAAAQAGARLARLSELDALAGVHAADAALEEALRRPVAGPELAIRTGLKELR